MAQYSIDIALRFKFAGIRYLNTYLFGRTWTRNVSLIFSLHNIYDSHNKLFLNVFLDKVHNTWVRKINFILNYDHKTKAHLKHSLSLSHGIKETNIETVVDVTAQTYQIDLEHQWLCLHLKKSYRWQEISERLNKYHVSRLNLHFLYALI